MVLALMARQPVSKELWRQLQPLIASRIVRRGVESSEKLGKHCWVVERTHSRFAGVGKLRIRFERRLDIHDHC